ncbi:AraC family transcriptional regulator [Pseudomonas sp. NA-150]|uniref:AraC family transcriptional regulator n=1 Tax=Pseudomonas sp. NA-150 TaxID=3367525 RepID=UPI0037C5B057
MEQNIGMTEIHDQSSGLAPEPDPFQRMDLLSQILTLIRLNGESVYLSEHQAPWSTGYPAGVSHFHVVRSGSVSVMPQGGVAIQAGQGDLLLLPHGVGHVISHGDQQPTQLMSGTFTLHGPMLSSLIAALPAVIHIRSEDGNAPDWLQAMTYFMMAETHVSMPGSTLMISRIIDLLVIRTLRTWADGHVSIGGWVGALADERMSRTLSAIHSDPQKPWTVIGLAQIAGMSRSVFVERFTAMVGESPHRYVSRWRLTLAATLLASGSVRVSEAAFKVGYASEAGFSRAFKAHFGYPPNDTKIASMSGRV